MTIWNKYKIIKEINQNSNIKTYLTKLEIETIVIEILPKDIEDYYRKKEQLEKLKYQMNIYEIKEENKKIYIVIDNNEDLLSNIDKLLLSDKINIQKEGII